MKCRRIDSMSLMRDEARSSTLWTIWRARCNRSALSNSTRTRRPMYFKRYATSSATTPRIRCIYGMTYWRWRTTQKGTCHWLRLNWSRNSCMPRLTKNSAKSWTSPCTTSPSNSRRLFSQTLAAVRSLKTSFRLTRTWQSVWSSKSICKRSYCVPTRATRPRTSRPSRLNKRRSASQSKRWRRSSKTKWSKCRTSWTRR